MAADSDNPRTWVTIRLYGPMRRYLSGLSQTDGVAVELVPGRTLTEALRQIGVSEDADWAAVVGDRIVAPDYVPRPGDIITILPPLAGG